MPHPRLWAVALFAAVAVSSAHAATVTVPDDHATIQEALDSGADTILVRSGDYAEHPLVVPDRPIVLSGHPLDPPGSLPRIDAVTVRTAQDLDELPVLASLHVAGVLTLDTRQRGHGKLVLDGCRLDAGLTHLVDDVHSLGFLSIKRCEIQGLVQAWVDGTIECDSNTVVNGGFWFESDYGRLYARGNQMEGNGDGFAFYLGYAVRAELIGNRISRYRVGASIEAEGPVIIRDNRVSDCQAAGIGVNRSFDLEVTGNTVSRCGGGIQANTEDSDGEIRDNTVTGCVRDGILFISELSDQTRIENNVCGRNGRAGISILMYDVVYNRRVVISGNTCYLNQGPGVRVTGDVLSYSMWEGVVSHNIGFRNQGHGLEVQTADMRFALDCNDWFENAAGATSGVDPGATDLAVDPGFCAVHQDDVQLAATSPLLDAPGCGRIGARGQGCDEVTATLVALFVAEAVPGGIEIRWRLAGDATAESWIERAGSPTGPWARIATMRSDAGGVTVERDATAEPGRDYWYRLSWITREGERGTSDALQATAGVRGPISLGPVSPNPTSGPISFVLGLPRATRLELVIHDLQGREVARLAGGTLEAGTHRFDWDGRSTAGPAPAGIYFLRANGPDLHGVRRFMLRR